MPHNDTSEVLLLLGQLDGKMDRLITQADDHGERLTVIEAWKNRLIGVALVMGAAVGGFASKIAPLVAGALPAGH